MLVGGGGTLSSLWRLEDVDVNVWNIVLIWVSKFRLSMMNLVELTMLPFETRFASFVFFWSRKGGARVRSIGF